MVMITEYASSSYYILLYFFAVGEAGLSFWNDNVTFAGCNVDVDRFNDVYITQNETKLSIVYLNYVNFWFCLVASSGPGHLQS